MTFSEAVRQTVPLRTSRRHLATIIRALESIEPADKTGVGDVLSVAAESYPRRGMMVLISDLLADPEDTLRGLQLLRQQGHDVLVFHVLDDDEVDFPFSGPARFDGMETTERLRCNPRALRDGYLAALDEFLSTLRHGCADHGVEYTLVRTSDAFDAALLTLLSRRMSVRRQGA